MLSSNERGISGPHVLPKRSNGRRNDIVAPDRHPQLHEQGLQFGGAMRAAFGTGSYPERHGWRYAHPGRPHGCARDAIIAVVWRTRLNKGQTLETSNCSIRRAISCRRRNITTSTRDAQHEGGWRCAIGGAIPYGQRAPMAILAPVSPCSTTGMWSSTLQREPRCGKRAVPAPTNPP